MEYPLEEIAVAVGAIIVAAAGGIKWMRSAKGTEDAPSVMKLHPDDRKLLENMKKSDCDHNERLDALTTVVELLADTSGDIAASVKELLPEIRQTNENVGHLLERQRYPNTGD